MATRQVVVQALQIRKKKEFGPIAIALPAKWHANEFEPSKIIEGQARHNPDDRPCSRAEYEEAR